MPTRRPKKDPRAGEIEITFVHEADGRHYRVTPVDFTGADDAAIKAATARITGGAGISLTNAFADPGHNLELYVLCAIIWRVKAQEGGDDAPSYTDVLAATTFKTMSTMTIGRVPGDKEHDGGDDPEG